jgi:hypothetical protein
MAGTIYLSDQDIAALLAFDTPPAALEARLIRLRDQGTEPAPVVKLPARSRTVAPDYRTAAEIWAAGGTVKRSKRTKNGTARTAIATFADGETVRVTTYLDGQAGLNEAGAFARSTRQNPLRFEPYRHKTWDGKVEHRNRIIGNPTQWVRDGAGVWRLVAIEQCPEIVSLRYADQGEEREAA